MIRFSILILILFSKQVFAAPLAHDGPERKQLIAMGYEIAKEDKGDTFTIAEMGNMRIVFSKNEDRLAISRYFTRDRKLNQADEMELQRIVNTFNAKYSYQFSISEGTLTANLYVFGNYDPKTFAIVVRLMGKVTNIFDTESNLSILINNWDQINSTAAFITVGLSSM